MAARSWPHEITRGTDRTPEGPERMRPQHSRWDLGDSAFGDRSLVIITSYQSGASSRRKICSQLVSTACRANAGLSCCNQGLSDGVNRKCDAVRHSYLTHQFGHVRLDRAFFNPQRGAYLLVGAAYGQQFQHLLLSVCEGIPTYGEKSGWKWTWRARWT
jgi:hypothetical protein